VSPDRPNPSAADYLSVAAVSAALLAFEILLLRLFSLTQWHHFASLAVALALLGFGAAGTLLTLLADRARRWGDPLHAGATAAAGLLLLAILPLNRLIEIHPLFIIWDVRQLLRLLALDLAAFLPFMAGAVAIGQVFVRWPAATRRLYGANLLGSGAGSLGAVALLATVGLPAALMLLGGFLLLTAALFGCLPRPGARPRARACGGLAAAGLLLLVAWAALPGSPAIRVPQFTELNFRLSLPDAEVIAQHHGPRGLSTLLRSSSNRLAPGLSLQWFSVVPSHDVLILDADRAIPLPAPAAFGDLDYLDAALGALPWRLRPRATTLVLGTSAWLMPLHARRADAADLVWVEDDPRISSAVARTDPGLAARLRRQAPRSALATLRKQFSLIVVETAAGGGEALAESPLLTVDALAAMSRRLAPDGFLVIPLPLANPPRHLPRLLAMIHQCLVQGGADDPPRHVIALRALHDALVLVAPAPFSPGDIARARAFADQWGFDLIWHDGLDPADANRHARLAEPLYYAAAAALLAGRDTPTPAARFYNRLPATDARPYFWYSVDWTRLPDLLRTLGRRGLTFVDWDALMQATALAAAALLALLLIVAPLGRLPAARRPLGHASIWLYFSALGLGYLMLELAVFQRATLLLGSPVVAAAVIFATFLIASGMGSLTAPEAAIPSIAARLFAFLALGVVLAALVLWGAGDRLLALRALPRAVVLVFAAAPMAWAMGRPMPWGLRRLGAQPDWIPWAWGINGFTSVLAAPLAALVSVRWGQPVTWTAALLGYAVAAAVAFHWSRPHP